MGLRSRALMKHLMEACKLPEVQARNSTWPSKDAPQLPLMAQHATECRARQRYHNAACCMILPSQYLYKAWLCQASSQLCTDSQSQKKSAAASAMISSHLIPALGCLSHPPRPCIPENVVGPGLEIQPYEHGA